MLKEFSMALVLAVKGGSTMRVASHPKPQFGYDLNEESIQTLGVTEHTL